MQSAHRCHGSSGRRSSADAAGTSTLSGAGGALPRSFEEQLYNEVTVALAIAAAAEHTAQKLEESASIAAFLGMVRDAGGLVQHHAARPEAVAAALLRQEADIECVQCVLSEYPMITTDAAQLLFAFLAPGGARARDGLRDLEELDPGAFDFSRLLRIRGAIAQTNRVLQAERQRDVSPADVCFTWAKDAVDVLSFCCLRFEEAAQTCLRVLLPTALSPLAGMRFAAHEAMQELTYLAGELHAELSRRAPPAACPSQP
mmetsp:Transcript_53172/g.149254  ORF Transcript_53172/g.149254 Transcript_53172/m.149254 type:complete len:258 (-) Transcript_53172:152-925(-)